MNSFPEPRRIHPFTLWIPIIVIMGGIVVAYNYFVKLSMEKRMPRPPVLSRLEKNLTLQERSGQTVELKELKGKVIVACWVYTHCPRGCAGVVTSMLRLYKEFENDPDVRFLSVSVDPDDHPADLKKFADGLGIDSDKWWFVNGPKDVLRSYMTRYFSFTAVQDIPEAERASPGDKFLHDFRVALVDREGQVRGLYDISSADPAFSQMHNDRIRHDMKLMLAETRTSANWIMGLVLLIVMAISVVSLLIMAFKNPPGSNPVAESPSTGPEVQTQGETTAAGLEHVTCPWCGSHLEKWQGKCPSCNGPIAPPNGRRPDSGSPALPLS